MGAFYTNFVLKGASPEAAQKILAGRKAIIATDRSGFVVVADEEAEDQDEDLINDIAAFLSQELCLHGHGHLKPRRFGLDVLSV